MNASRCTQVLLLPIVLLAACGRSKTEESTYTAPPTMMPSPAPSMTADDAGAASHINSAHQNFLKKDFAKSADEIRAASARLKQDAQNAPAEASKEMKEAAAALDRAETDVRAGAMTDISKLDHDLAKANASLARFHALQATDAWVARNSRDAGREIVSAVDQVEAATKRLGHQLSSEDASFSSHARSLGIQLIEGAQVAEHDVGVTLRGLDREIDSLFRDLKKGR